MKKHLLSKHKSQDQDLSCSICKKKFSIKSGLEAHLEMHKEIFPWKCGRRTCAGKFDKLTEFGRDNFISQATMRKFGAFLGENDVKIEAGLRDELVRQNHILDNYYHVKELEFLIDKKSGKFAKKPAVVCKNASDLIMHVFELRNQSMHDFIVKFNFDNGQNYLKLSCSLIPKKGWRKKQKKGRNWNGANTVIILGIAHSVPENHHNIAVFYEHTEFYSVKGIKALDHKMKKLDAGLMPSTSSHPSTNCKVHFKSLGTCMEVQTF